jgi:hypothetical protein
MPGRARRRGKRVVAIRTGREVYTTILVHNRMVLTVKSLQEKPQPTSTPEDALHQRRALVEK